MSLSTLSAPGLATLRRFVAGETAAREDVRRFLYEFLKAAVAEVASGGAAAAAAQAAADAAQADADAANTNGSALAARVSPPLKVTALAVAATPGQNNAALTLSMRLLDGSAPGPKQVVIAAVPTSQAYDIAPPNENSIGFNTATVGRIVAFAPGRALVELTGAGEFACTVTNSDDEALSFRVVEAVTVDNADGACKVVPHVPLTVTWVP